jgi:hypothetical protein
MLTSIVFHTRNPRIPLGLLVPSPEKQSRTGNQDNTRHRADNNASDGSTTQFLRTTCFFLAIRGIG